MNSITNCAILSGEKSYHDWIPAFCHCSNSVCLLLLYIDLYRSVHGQETHQINQWEYMCFIVLIAYLNHCKKTKNKNKHWKQFGMSSVQHACHQGYIHLGKSDIECMTQFSMHVIRLAAKYRYM